MSFQLTELIVAIFLGIISLKVQFKLISWIDQEPEVLTGTKIHIERDEAEAGAWGKCIEPPNSETK